MYFIAFRFALKGIVCVGRQPWFQEAEQRLSVSCDIHVDKTAETVIDDTDNI